MCDPMTIAGIALSAGGAAANMSAQSKVASARKDVMAAERIRQRGYDQETDALNASSQNRYQNFGEQQAETSSKLGDFFKGATADATSGAPAPAPTEPSLMPASSSNIVNSETAKQMGQAKAYTDQQGEALGSLRGFGDLMGGIGRLQARDAGQIGQIGGFKKGSSNVVGLELEEANGAGGNMSMLGDILGGLGKLGVSAGIGGSPFGKAGVDMGLPVDYGGLKLDYGVKLPTLASGIKFSAPMNIGPKASLPTFAQGASPFKGY